LPGFAKTPYESSQPDRSLPQSDAGDLVAGVCRLTGSFRGYNPVGYLAEGRLR
jgi:hypothetical protein